MYGVVDVNVDIVKKIVVLKTLELIINNRLHVKKLRKIIIQ